MSGCQKCGAPTTRSRFCRACGRDERYSSAPVGGTSADRDDSPGETTGDDWAVEQRGLDGERHEGQATLDGGVAKDGGGQ
jgi:hypothetical protein